MDKFITVFTPTFNRAYCLGQLYESLVSQTNQDFIWLIIDDGSSDGTEILVNSWIAKAKIEIKYVFQENQGMHGGHNTAYKNITTELNVCVDSDDYMPKNAIENIISTWKKNENGGYAGLIGLDAFKDDSIVGTKFPDGMSRTKYGYLKGLNITGDKKFVYKTDIIQKYPEYPIFKGEKFVPLNYKYLLIDQDYDMLAVNEVYCIVEYLPDGSSKNIIRQYIRNPKGFEFERKVRMKYAFSLTERFKNAVHYISCAIFLKNWNFISESSNKLLTILAIPFGILLHIYIRNTSKKGWK